MQESPADLLKALLPQVHQRGNLLKYSLETTGSGLSSFLLHSPPPYTAGTHTISTTVWEEHEYIMCFP